MCLLSIYNATGRGGGNFFCHLISFFLFFFFNNFVSFLKLQTLQGFKVMCAGSSAVGSDSAKILKTCQPDLVSQLT